MTPKEVLALVKKHNVEMVDCRIIDPFGRWQHCSHPISHFDESTFEDGYGFDGSSIRGWKAINESDMLMMPDPASAFIDPFLAHPTLVLICDVVDPITRQPYPRDPRLLAKRAEAYLKHTGVADTAYFGPEAEFFVFDDARFGTGANHGFYELDSSEAVWNTGREEGGRNPGYKIRHKEATSRVHRTTRSRTSAPRCASRCRRWGSTSRPITTRWRPPARPRST